jgi:acyl carrier protein
MTTNTESLPHVLKTIATSIAEIMPGVDAATVSIDGRLADYGCNSIDRADIVWKTLEDLGLDIPVVEFSGVADIRGLAQVLCRHLEAR